MYISNALRSSKCVSHEYVLYSIKKAALITLRGHKNLFRIQNSLTERPQQANPEFLVKT